MPQSHSDPVGLIVGGGIGGLATALALHAKGIRVKVFETVPEIRALGVGINLLPHSTRVLIGLGLREPLEQTAILTRELRYHCKRGKEIWVEPRGLEAGNPFPQYSLHRGHLQMILLDAVRQRIGPENVLVDHHLVELEANGPEGVIARFESKQTHEPRGTHAGAFLIGCDGIMSRVRHLFYPQEGPPKFAGLMLWRGVVEGEPFLGGRSMVMAGHDTLKAVVYPISGEAERRGRSLINWVAERRVGPDFLRSPENWNRKGNKRDFVDAFADWDFGWLNFPKILEQTEEIYEFPMVDRDPLPRWTFDRVTLLGDAAHVMYPNGSNGASQAILDAEALAESLAAQPDVSQALQDYEDRRRPPTSKLVLDNRQTGPERVLQMVEQRCQGACGDVHTCIGREELAEVAASYKRLAGFDKESLLRASARPAASCHRNIVKGNSDMPSITSANQHRPARTSIARGLWKGILMSGVIIGAVFDGMAEAQQQRARVPEGVKQHLDLEFAKAGTRSLKLDLYVPETPAGQKRPAVVWIFPGAWMAGSRKGGPAIALSGEGYVVCSIDYRLSQEAKFPAQIEDCKAAVRWLRAHADEYSVDPDRIGVWGASAGGHLAALVGTSGGVAEFDVGDHKQVSSRVQAVVDWFGPSDFTQMAAHKPPGSRFDYGTAGSPEGRLVGGPIEEHMDLVRKANPVTFIGPDAPPFLIMHGDADVVVPYHQSQLLHEALEAKKLRTKFVTLKGSGHGTGDFNSPEVFRQVVAFFDEHLKGQPAAGATSGGTCDRDCLIGVMDRFLEALVKHDPKSLPLAASVCATENGQPIQLGEGPWKTATAVKSRQYFADPAGGQVAFAGAIDEGETPAILFVRLKVEAEKITEVETIRAHRGDHALFTPQSVVRNPSIYNEPVPANQRTPREQMIAAANSYFDGIEQHNGERVPFAPGCTRLENGVQMAGGAGRNIADGMRAFTYIPRVRDRRFPIVDEERGVVGSVIVFDMPGNAPAGGQEDARASRAPRSLLLAEVFKVVEGKIVAIDAYMVNRELNAPGGW